MKSKTIKIIYWIVTLIFALFMLFSAVTGLIPTEQSKVLFETLGYPLYSLTIISVAKVLGVVAILQWKFNILKEWAYAGFAIDIIGASASFAFTKETFGAIFTLIFLLVMFISYFLWKKVDNI